MARRKTPDPLTVLRAVEEAGGDLDVSKLASELLHQFGGARGLAEECKKHYTNTASATAKGKMLEAIMRLLSAATPKHDPLDNLGGVRTEDLVGVLNKLVGNKGPAA